MTWYKRAQYTLLETIKMQGENGLPLGTMSFWELKEAKKYEEIGRIYKKKLIDPNDKKPYLSYFINENWKPVLKPFPKKASAEDQAARIAFEKEVQQLAGDSVHVEFEEYGGDKYLEMSSIEAVEPGKGEGTRVMKGIITLADKYGISLVVIPAGMSTRDPNFLKLQQWYEQFGFQGDDAMHRPV